MTFLLNLTHTTNEKPKEVAEERGTVVFPETG
jgi:hypothetical protein